MFSKTMIYVMPELFLETKRLDKMSRFVRNKSGALGILCYKGRGARASVGRVSAGPYRGVPKKFPMVGPIPPQEHVVYYLNV